MGTYEGFNSRKHEWGSARKVLDPSGERYQRAVARAEAALAEPFVGFTADGTAETGLFPVQDTGVSTKPLKQAADAFVATLTPEQRPVALLPIDSGQWRLWMNGEGYSLRHGLLLEAMPPAQLDAALNLLKASLSIRGYNQVRDVMKLNEVIREITEDDANLGEWLYFLNLFGMPSMDEPWGWQIDGHHLNISCFVLRDQVVISPSFLGAEPCIADRGPYRGLRAFEEEERNGLDMIRSLSPVLREKAILFESTKWEDLPKERTHPSDGRHQGGALRDNTVLPYEGVRGDELTAGQKHLLLSLIDNYIGRMRPGHDQVKMEEIKHHLDRTYFAWMGGFDDDSPFYYKVHSPVTLIEFDHHHGVFLDNYQPEKFHIHTVVRTPNGNDYGKDLLRQHLEQAHAPPTA